MKYQYETKDLNELSLVVHLAYSKGWRYNTRNTPTAALKKFYDMPCVYLNDENNVIGQNFQLQHHIITIANINDLIKIVNGEKLNYKNINDVSIGKYVKIASSEYKGCIAMVIYGSYNLCACIISGDHAGDIIDDPQLLVEPVGLEIKISGDKE